MKTIPKNKNVRDLWWLLNSPGLITAPNFFDVPNAINKTDWQALDEKPQALENAIENSKRKNLGSYAETLFMFALEEMLGAQSIFHSVQLQDEHKTLGEMDFIYQINNTTYHTELSVKFFMWESKRKQLLGAKLKDTLDKRIERFDSQIGLLNTKEGKAFLKENELANCKPHLLFKGYFFYPLNDADCPFLLPYPLSDRSKNYRWCKVKDLSNLPHDQAALLTKRQWLSPSMKSDDIEIKSPADLMGDATKRLAEREHSIVMSVFDGISALETTRYMIVPDGWPAIYE